MEQIITLHILYPIKIPDNTVRKEFEHNYQFSGAINHVHFDTLYHQEFTAI